MPLFFSVCVFTFTRIYCWHMVKFWYLGFGWSVHLLICQGPRPIWNINNFIAFNDSLLLGVFCNILKYLSSLKPLIAIKNSTQRRRPSYAGFLASLGQPYGNISTSDILLYDTSSSRQAWKHIVKWQWETSLIYHLQFPRENRERAVGIVIAGDFCFSAMLGWYFLLHNKSNWWSVIGPS